jgi:type I restriction enzyme M protein
MTARPPGWRSINLGQLIDQEFLLKRQGHGSPSADQRIGTVPYIKVSDLRAGLVNINPTNMIPRPLAEHFWSGPSSGLDAYDLLCPERASKNIGDFCVLMPGQENVVLTKEVIVLRVLPAAQFDSFYLLWALTLSVVRKQWERIIFMQTNREDVGNRFREIQIPIAPNRIEADTISTAFRTYFEKLSEARNGLAKYLADSADHHYFLDA